MDDIIPADWGGAFVGGFGFATAFLTFKAIWAAIQWAVTFKTAREDKREEQIDHGTSELLDRMKGEIDRVSGECAKLRERADATEQELRHCREQHSECEARVKQLEATMLGLGDARQHAALIVASEKRKDQPK